MKTFTRFSIIALAPLVFFSVSCTQKKSPYMDTAGAYGNVAARASERPGLGTEWGEDRNSRVTGRSFERGGSRPFSTDKFFYNDEAGSKAMANMSGFAWRRSGPFTAAKGTVSIGLKGAGGGFLKSYSASGDNFYVGDHGDRYEIWVKNLTNTRLELVVSVDGLDVLDGKSAAYSKRGYLVGPKDTITIDGFRQSNSQVAAFRFGSVADSYAQRKHGNSRNVGVIGVAVFPEYGHNPFNKPWDANRRINADPFPREYATPPGR